MTNEHGYSLCLRTLQRSIDFILEHPAIDSLDMQSKLAIIEVTGKVRFFSGREENLVAIVTDLKNICSSRPT